MYCAAGLVPRAGERHRCRNRPSGSTQVAASARRSRSRAEDRGPPARSAERGGRGSSGSMAGAEQPVEARRPRKRRAGSTSSPTARSDCRPGRARRRAPRPPPARPPDRPGRRPARRRRSRSAATAAPGPVGARRDPGCAGRVAAVLARLQPGDLRGELGREPRAAADALAPASASAPGERRGGGAGRRCRSRPVPGSGRPASRPTAPARRVRVRFGDGQLDGGREVPPDRVDRPAQRRACGGAASARAGRSARASGHASPAQPVRSFARAGRDLLSARRRPHRQQLRRTCANSPFLRRGARSLGQPGAASAAVRSSRSVGSCRSWRCLAPSSGRLERRVRGRSARRRAGQLGDQRDPFAIGVLRSLRRAVPVPPRRPARSASAWTSRRASSRRPSSSRALRISGLARSACSRACRRSPLGLPAPSSAASARRVLSAPRRRLLGRGQRRARCARSPPGLCGAAAARRRAATARVSPVVAEEALPRDACASAIAASAVAVLLQAAERLGDVGDHGLVQRRQRLGERVGQRLLAGPLRQLRLAQLDQQVDQRLVTLLAEAEERLVDRPAVVPSPVVDRARAAQRLDEPVAGERGAGGVDQGQVVTDPLAGDEEPVPGDAAPGRPPSVRSRGCGTRGRRPRRSRPNSSQV